MGEKAISHDPTGLKRPATYRDAGVDIDAGAALVDAIKPMVARTMRAGMVGGIGGFGGLFDPKAAGFRDPILVAATDGVGTKLRVAFESGRHDTVGIDLVAMCVNDLVVQGAEPLFFLDYFATGHLAVEDASAVIAGVATGCEQAGCALLGGETAEMPGSYPAGEYDLAGFAVGAVERAAVLTGETVREGDTILGLASSGVHSNGYSLVRRLVAQSGLSYGDPAPFDPDQSLGEALLAPTRIYVRACLAAIRVGGVHALAHITGGGLVENIPRVLPDGLGAVLDAAAWTAPPVFSWLARSGPVAAEEMARTFNCGIGMAVVVDPERADAIETCLRESGETVHRIGKVVRAEGTTRTTIESMGDGAGGAWSS